ncbi:MAG: FGGY family carbohydrate kinase, partial [Eubacteriales bacterium]|nr:FGGY family carbohydrate kinase [Eubacteriales bacterium]
MEKYIIGIDSGTTSIKAVVMDVLGNEVYKKDFKLTAICPRQDMYEEDMREIWNNARLALKDVGARFDRDSIIGIGITAQGDGLWMIDENGEPVRNGCCFCDGRASEIVDEWVDDGTCDRLFDRTGTRVFTGNQNGIVKWMERHEPESLQKAKHLLHLKDYLFYKLTGMITTDATDQSLIFLNPVTRQYDPRAFELCGLEAYMDKYPPVLPAEENAFRLQKSVADELGLSDQILVTSGPMDVSACALGSGVVEPGHCCSIIGTAALHEMVIDKPLTDTIHAGMTVAHVMPGRWLRLMASLAGTPNLEWALNTFGGELKREAAAKNTSVYALAEALAKEVPIGARGVMYHPYLLAGGERAPFTDAGARAGYTNLNVTHSLADLLRA